MHRSSETAPTIGESGSIAFHEASLTDAEVERLPLRLQLRIAAWFRVSEQFEQATQVLERLAVETEESASVMNEQAALALSLGDAAAVRAHWNYRIERFPKPSAHVSFARALMELGELTDANVIADELMELHGEMVSVQALAADLALLEGDLGTAHDLWNGQLEQDSARVAPLLALARIALLGGDLEEARAALDRAVVDPSALTAAQLATGAGLAEVIGQPSRAQALRLRFAKLESMRAAALAAEIDAALGRTTGSTPNGNDGTRPSPERERNSDAGNAHPRAAVEPLALHAAIEPADVVRVAEEALADDRVMTTLSEVFAYQSLLPGQAAVINRALAGQHTLAILPTGAGKSLTFQLSALLLPATTVVLSPLIALMKDQVESLPAALRQRTVLVNSTLSPTEQTRAVEEIAAGSYKLVYAAPERLRQQSFLRALRQAGVSLVVVDEAHCISLWGHDFRPDYLSIPAALPELGNPPLLAMTATASPETAASLATAFRRDLDVVRTSSFRPNLFYTAERLGTKEEKARRVVALCREMRGQGIVYVSSRRDAENLAGVL
ncbi:MAG: DEAD/DEAH box helicase, partial [Chloroflexota bacterium]|nr:DEAD/DEAH box helicase [Chloroflexota bacterium]